MIKKISFTAISFLSFFFLLILIFDIIIYLLKPNIINNFSHFYKANEDVQQTRNFPRDYFINDDKKGFDIRSSAKPINLRVPSEIGYEYPIFSNNEGCFNLELSENKSKQEIIYMAGDSFTWAYVPYEKKFSTIYNDLNSKYIVLNCGVPHTGQLHQFSKFNDIFNQHDNISVVIVNLVANDVDNDFFYPHTTVIDGDLIEDSFWCIENNDIKKIKKSRESINREKSLPQFLISLLRYSASSNVAYFSARNIAKYLMYNTNASKYLTCPNLSPNIYGYKNWSYNIQDEFAAPNIKAIKKWINHSKSNNYRLIFSIIPHKDKNIEHFRDLEIILKGLNAEFYNFNNYIIDEGLPKDKLYWVHDGHFNIAGNIAYANYLFANID